MAVRATEGFDMYNGIQARIGLQSRWTPNQTSEGPTMVTGRFGGQAVQLNTLASFGTQTLWALMFPTGPSALALGFAFEATTTSDLGRILEVQNSSLASLCGVGFNAIGQMIVYNGAGGTTLATSTAAGLIPASTWVYIELEIVLSASAGSINAYINGQEVISVSGVNTGAGPAFVLQAVCLAANNSQTFANTYDDIYTTDVATKLGEQRIETLRPASNSSVQWTPSSGSNYADVNGTTVSGTTYVSTATVGNLDLYGIASLSETPSSISAVNVVSFAEKTDAGLRAITNTMVSGSTEQDGAEIYLSGSFGRNDSVQITNPATGSPWTATGVNALLIGPKLAA